MSTSPEDEIVERWRDPTVREYVPAADNSKQNTFGRDPAVRALVPTSDDTKAVTFGRDPAVPAFVAASDDTKPETLAMVSIRSRMIWIRFVRAFVPNSDDIKPDTATDRTCSNSDDLGL